eukprot:4400862-Pleurochrysis_carterae.AAC.1
MRAHARVPPHSTLHCPLLIGRHPLERPVSCEYESNYQFPLGLLPPSVSLRTRRRRQDLFLPSPGCCRRCKPAITRATTSRKASAF